MSVPEDAGLRGARPERDLEDDRVRAAVASRLFGRGPVLKIGRFEVRARIGSGAMGVVYEAHDPKLDRQVALKVLDARGGGAAGHEREAWLLREARAAARLSHPNVVAVHDAGSHEGRVWVAMELVRGETLRDWWEAEARSWSEIVRIFAQVGAGLAAAHRAGLVHRDFKPENVLIEAGRDGQEPRARVVDFGLARDMSAAGSAEAQAPRPDVSVTLGSGDGEVAGEPGPGDLTRTGVLAGTPAYMAPEQFDGARVDARADQFAFFVTLHEALFGVRPFAGQTVHAIRANMDAGRVDRGNGRRIPRWLHTMLRRGLERAPQRRHASMDVVVDELERRPAQRRRRTTMAGGGGGVRRPRPRPRPGAGERAGAGRAMRGRGEPDGRGVERG